MRHTVSLPREPYIEGYLVGYYFPSLCATVTVDGDDIYIIRKRIGCQPGDVRPNTRVPEAVHSACRELDRYFEQGHCPTRKPLRSLLSVLTQMAGGNCCKQTVDLRSCTRR